MLLRVVLVSNALPNMFKPPLNINVSCLICNVHYVEQSYLLS